MTGREIGSSFALVAILLAVLACTPLRHRAAASPAQAAGPAEFLDARPPATVPTTAAPVPAPPAAAVSFVEDVQPILAVRCQPCHFPGGKMYASMPFDAPATIRAHPEGTLRRFQGDELATVRAFLEAP